MFERFSLRSSAASAVAASGKAEFPFPEKPFRPAAASTCRVRPESAKGNLPVDNEDNGDKAGAAPAAPQRESSVALL